MLARSAASAHSRKADSSQKRQTAVRGFSTQASDEDISSYFKEQAKRAQATAKKQQYRSGQLSSKQATSQLLNYFAQEEALAAKPHAPAKHSKASQHAATKAAHGLGLSGTASRKDFAKYFATEAHPPPPSYVGFSASAAVADLKGYFAAQQMLAQPAERPPAHGMSSAAARADLADYFSPARKAAPAAAAATPAMIFSRLRDHKRASAAEKAKAQADAAASHRLSSAAATKDLAAFFSSPPAAKAPARAARKAAAPAQPAKQALAAYGVGVEDDNAVEVGKAYGVSKTLPGPPVFTANKAPEPKTIDEVNEAIRAQRIDGYTNGNGQPAEDVALPPGA